MRKNKQDRTTYCCQDQFEGVESLFPPIQISRILSCLQKQSSRLQANMALPRSPFANSYKNSVRQSYAPFTTELKHV